MDDPLGALIAHLASLQAGPVADLAAARALAALEPEDAARSIAGLVARAKQTAAAGMALAAVGRALLFDSGGDLSPAHRGQTYAAAVRLGLTETAAFFVREEPAQRVDPAAFGPPDPCLANLTVGHKKAGARSAGPDLMARLAVEGDVRVIRELLLNPRLTEEMVVRLVARRPGRAEVQVEVFRSSKWSVRSGVRRALAMNPSTPPEVALQALPHLAQADLRAIARDRSLSPTVREMAARMLRPPGG